MAFKYLIFIFYLSYHLCQPGYNTPWGIDADIYKEKTSYTAPTKNNDYLHYIFENVILFHQNILSPVDGPRSHFRPTSARYMF